MNYAHLGWVILMGFVVTSCSSGPTTTLKIQIQGAGHVFSNPPGINCQQPEGGAPTGECSLSTANPEILHLQATPADGFTVGGWGFSSEADCGSCDSEDPEVGAMVEKANEADVKIDVNEGYDATETLTVFIDKTN